MTDKKRKLISESYLHQISVLRSMSTESKEVSTRIYELSEISTRSGIRDEREVLRYLYILEGQKLVSPQPEGDFTAKTWCITGDGMRALKVIESSTVQ